MPSNAARIALLSLFFVVACRASVAHERPPTPVRVQGAQVRGAQGGLRYSATLKPNEQVALSFRSGGYVKSVLRVRGVGGMRFLAEGDFVRKGTVLARVREVDYEVKVSQARSRLAEAMAQEKRAHAALAQSQSTPDAARSRLDEAQAALDKARLDHERVTRLVKSRTLSQADFDTTRTRLAMAEATTQGAKVGVGVAPTNIDASRAQVDLAQAGVAGARAILSEAEIALADTAIRAPFNGVVLKRGVDVGALAGPGLVAFVLADMRTMKAGFGVPDTMVDRMKLGTALGLRLAARPDEELLGRITRISPAADPQSRAFEVEVSLANDGRRLKAGMIASLRVAAPDEKATLAVPLSAVLRPRGQTSGYAVLVVEKRGNDLVARERRVTLGKILGNEVAVGSGLAAGDQVVVAGSTIARPGDPVRIVP